MAFKFASLCAFALLAQCITAQPCYQPRPAPPCGCGSESVSISLTQGQSCNQPAPPSCGCNSGSLSIGVYEGAQTISRPVPLPTPCRSKSVAIGSLSNGYQSISAPCVSINVPEYGGEFLVTSIGPVAPSGIAVATELGLAGNLEVEGALPYLTAVAFEGQFDTSGSAAVEYGCGNGCVAITEQIGSGNYAGAANGNYGGAVNVNYGGAVNVNRGCGCGCY